MIVLGLIMVMPHMMVMTQVAGSRIRRARTILVARARVPGARAGA